MIKNGSKPMTVDFCKGLALSALLYALLALACILMAIP